MEEEATERLRKFTLLFFKVEHLVGLGFRNRKGISVSFDLPHFTFHSKCRVSTIDNRGMDTLFAVDFVLRLSQTLVLVAEPFSSNVSSNISSPTPSVNTDLTKPDEVETLKSELESMDDVAMDTLSIDTIRALLKRSMVPEKGKNH